MIKYIQGDIFYSQAQTLVATVNCVGVMGKGLAKEFKDRYPEMFKGYARVCKSGELRQGRFYIYDELDKKILCFPTKDNWKGPSKYEFIEEGLKTLRNEYVQMGISSIAIPPLGSGLGGLDWSKVKALIVRYLQDLPIDIEIYEPLVVGDRVVRPTNPFKKMDKVSLTPSTVYTGEIIRLARHAFPEEMPIGRLLLQKLAFFAQMAGLPIKLQFAEYNFGPYEHRLKFNVEKLEGLYIRDLSPSVHKSDLVMLDEAGWLKAIQSLGLDLTDAQKKIERAVGFLKNRNLRNIELLASVLLAWVSLASSGNTGSSHEVIEYIRNWKFEKFQEAEILNAMQDLADAGWIGPVASQGADDLNCVGGELLAV